MSEKKMQLNEMGNMSIPYSMISAERTKLPIRLLVPVRHIHPTLSKLLRARTESCSRSKTAALQRSMDAISTAIHRLCKHNNTKLLLRSACDAGMREPFPFIPNAMPVPVSNNTDAS